MENRQQYWNTLMFLQNYHTMQENRDHWNAKFLNVNFEE